MNYNLIKEGDNVMVNHPSFISSKWYDVKYVAATFVTLNSIDDIWIDVILSDITTLQQDSENIFAETIKEEEHDPTQYAPITDKLSAITVLKAMMFDSMVVDNVPLTDETYEFDYEELQVLVKLLEGTEFATKIKAHIYDYRESDFDESLWYLGLNGLEASDILDVLQGE